MLLLKMVSDAKLHSRKGPSLEISFACGSLLMSKRSQGPRCLTSAYVLVSPVLPVHLFLLHTGQFLQDQVCVKYSVVLLKPESFVCLQEGLAEDDRKLCFMS